jgi:hypothetical protein
MIGWIKSVIDPPGIDKKNRFSIFKAIGDIMGRVLADAKKALSAHFPYIADEKKLEEHGRALYIPRLMHDKSDDFRNRVAAASFFLMKAGSRGFITDLLEERFGDRFQVVEKFLQLQTTVVDLTDEERIWIFGLLDSLIDPNVSLGFTDRRNTEVNVHPGVLPVLRGRFDILPMVGGSTAWVGMFPEIKGRFDILPAEMA